MCQMGGVPIGADWDPNPNDFNKRLQELKAHLEGGPTWVLIHIVARCDAAEVLEPAKHAFDRVAGAIKNRAEWRLEAAVIWGWDIWRGTAAVHRGPFGVGVVASVRQQKGAWRHLVEQQCGSSAIGNLATCEHKGVWATVIVG